MQHVLHTEWLIQAVTSDVELSDCCTVSYLIALEDGGKEADSVIDIFVSRTYCDRACSLQAMHYPPPPPKVKAACSMDADEIEKGGGGILPLLNHPTHWNSVISAPLKTSGALQRHVLEWRGDVEIAKEEFGLRGVRPGSRRTMLPLAMHKE